MADAALHALARSIFCVGCAGATPAALPLDALRAFGPGGVTLFARNIGSADDVRATIAALRGIAALPPLIAIDQEGGRVARIADEALVTPLPSAMALGAVNDAALCERLGRRLGAELAALGVSVDFAPCADLALDARNGVIGTRSFGDEPYTVGNLAAAFARGLEAGGVGAALKHFPGHGATERDSHRELPRVGADAATLRTRDLVPFGAVLAGEAASVVMAAHVVYDALDPTAPASLSARILTDILRGELDFDGVIATDCLEMDAIAATIGVSEGAVRALGAGADLLLVSHDLARAHAAAQAIVDAIERGTLERARLERAAARVRRLRERLATPSPAARPADFPAGDASDTSGAREALDAARRAVTGVRGTARLRDGVPVTVISFEGTIAEGIGPSAAAPASLSAALRRRRWKSEHMRVALEPDPDDVDLLLAQLPGLGDRNFVLVVRRALAYPAQAAAVARILALVPQALVVVAREPYDAILWTEARNVACTYGDDALAFAGLADVLSGVASAEGRLPVRIDAALGMPPVPGVAGVTPAAIDGIDARR